MKCIHFLNYNTKTNITYQNFKCKFKFLSILLILEKYLFNTVASLFVLKWLASYLHKRVCMFVLMVLSQEFVAISDVLQRSLMCPILFIIFINYVISDLYCSYLLFADNLKLCRKIICERMLFFYSESLMLS